MAKGWQCTACRAKNDAGAEQCEHCGVARPEPKVREGKEAGRPRQCELDGGPLDARGYCSVANGFVAAAPCPFACPFCRHALTWEGKCFACFGCSSGQREDWTVPGDRYELDKGHWYLVEKGPRAVCPYEQHVEALRIAQAVYQGALTVSQGHDMLELMGLPR